MYIVLDITVRVCMCVVGVCAIRIVFEWGCVRKCACGFWCRVDSLSVRLRVYMSMHVRMCVCMYVHTSLERGSLSQWNYDIVSSFSFLFFISINIYIHMFFNVLRAHNLVLRAVEVFVSALTIRYRMKLN